MLSPRTPRRGGFKRRYHVRLSLGLLLLLALFALALVWQRQVARTAHASTGVEHSSADLAHAYPSDWGRILIGAPSESDPLELPVVPSPPPAGSRTSGAPRSETVAAPPAARVFELTVRRGQTLSGICQAHYKTGRAEVVAAVARLNRIEDASALREGQKLKLPALESLISR